MAVPKDGLHPTGEVVGIQTYGLGEKFGEGGALRAFDADALAEEGEEKAKAGTCSRRYPRGAFWVRGEKAAGGFSPRRRGFRGGQRATS